MPSPDYQLTPIYGFRAAKGDTLISDTDAAFLALATDVENAPFGLKPASTSGATATAVDGQMLNCTGAAQTVTLPASAKGMVGIRAGGTQTGAAPVTIQRGGSALIKGPGHATGATSIKLGTPGAAVVLLWDGANWLVISGQQDTGWTAISLNTGINPVAGAFAPAIRVQGDQAELSGDVINNSGGTLAAGSLVASTGVGPVSTLWYVPCGCSLSTQPNPNVTLTTGGQIDIGFAWGNSVGVGFDSIKFRVS